MKNILVLQSGGPTAAINATLAGVVEQGLINRNIDKIYGSLYGIKGVLEDRIVEIGPVLSGPEAVFRLTDTPGAALGSCRKRLPESIEDPCYWEIFHTLERYNIGYMICIGGNDSMDTVVKLARFAKERQIPDFYIMGAPKTVDNDLYGMDHSPGFPSAARYVATTFAELWQDCNVYDSPAVTIVEIMGRHVGWLTASSVLARKQGLAPALIYLPERPISKEHFLIDVRQKLSEMPTVIIAVSEGLCYPDGKLLAEDFSSTVDGFGHLQLGGSGRMLESWVRKEIGCKVRAIELSLMQRSAGHITSPIDLYESRMLGMTAFSAALGGNSGEVAVLNRTSNRPYRVAYSTIDAAQVANVEKSVPESWITAAGNDVTEEMTAYLEPLVTHTGGHEYLDGLPNHFSFV